MIVEKYKHLFPEEIFNKKSFLYKHFIKNLEKIISKFNNFINNTDTELISVLVNSNISNEDIINHIINYRNPAKRKSIKTIIYADFVFFKLYDKLKGDSSLIDKWREINKDKINEAKEIEQYIAYAVQDYDLIKVKLDKINRLIDETDIEEDGMPRLGRGSLCRYYIPIKGLNNSYKINDKIVCYNPRNKKEIQYTITKIKENGDAYEVIDNRMKRYWFASYEDIQNAWSDLFSINKDIYSGWWNKSQIIKK